MDFPLQISVDGATLGSGVEELLTYSTQALRVGLGYADMPDTFNDASLGSQWTPVSGVTESGGLLHLAINGSVLYNRPVRGDFTMYVNPSGLISGSPFSTGGIRITFSANTYILLYNRIFNGGEIYCYCDGSISGTPFYTNSPELSDTVKTLKLVRSGTSISAYYDTAVTATPILFVTKTGMPTTEPTEVKLYGTVKAVDFDNWSITSQYPYSNSSPEATLAKIGAGAGLGFKVLGSGLWIPESSGLSGAPAPNYQYAKLAGYADSPTYNGSWLTQAQLRTALGERTDTIEGLMLKAQFPSAGALGCSIDDGYIPAEMVSSGGASKYDKFAKAGIRRIYG